jgi:hypothetical protein
MVDGGSIWIIGLTGAGKSTLAKRLAAETGLEILEAGRFAREVSSAGADTRELTATTLELLQADHRYFSRLILERVRGRRLIVVGVRNPVDFTDSFNPHTDRVLLLDAGVRAASAFEAEGVEAVGAVLTFFLATGVLARHQVERLTAVKHGSDWYAETHP